MKKHLPRILIALLVIAGIALLLYPTVSNWLYERNAPKAIQGYNEAVENLDEEEIAMQWAMAEKYNAALSGSDIEDPFVPGSGAVLPDNYTMVLDTDDGIMGYIEIPKIDVYLPIFHGTGEAELQKGAGHIENTAFPIGGEGNHAVITGHRAMTKAKMFTDLDKLAEGDVFYVHVLNETLAYQVDQILVVEPEDTTALRPVSGEDYVSLVTCTPYGINSHRLLIRETHIPYTKEEQEDKDSLPFTINWRIMIIVVVLVIFGIFWFVMRRKGRRKP